jgi:uncharacterized membrane protein
MEAFSDGGLAIAITRLILEVRPLRDMHSRSPG